MGPGSRQSSARAMPFTLPSSFARSGVDHVHVHFANRAAHTAIFLKEISGIPFSVTAHGQDFMKDLGSDDLLREICAAAEFVAAETDYSRDLLRQRCPDSAAKIHRVYNGIDLERFPAPRYEQLPRRSPYSAHRERRPAGYIQGFRRSHRRLRRTRAPPNRFCLRHHWRRSAARDASGEDRASWIFRRE